MKKKRLFFGVLVSFMMVVSLIPKSILAQPPLPDNDYEHIPFNLDHTDTNIPITEDFTIEVEHSQYWQGSTIAITLTKHDENVILDENHEVLMMVATGRPPFYRNWVPLSYPGIEPAPTRDLKVLVEPTIAELINLMGKDDSLTLHVTPGNPRGPLGFYQPEFHDVYFGFFIENDDETNDGFHRSEKATFKNFNEDVEYEFIRDDALYFVGDELTLDIVNLPKGYNSDGTLINDANPTTNTVVNDPFNYVRVHTVVCEQPNYNCEATPIFTGQTTTYFEYDDKDIDPFQSITISGEINPEIGQVFIGYVVELSSTGENFSVVTNNTFKFENTHDYHIIGVWEDGSPGTKALAHPDEIYQDDLIYVMVNFDLQTTDLVLPDLREFSSLYETDKVMPITKTGVGTIEFDAGINILGNREQFERLNQSISIAQDVDNKKLTAKVDTQDLAFLADIGATIIFEKAMETLGITNATTDNFMDYVDFEITDNQGELVEDITAFIDLENSSYNPTTDVLRLRVFHFTEYVLTATEVEDDEEDPVFKTVVDIALSSPDFSILVEALQKAKLVEALLGAGPFTVFAPTNDAFSALLEELDITKEELLDSEDLAKILLYHVIPDRIFVSEITDGLKVATLNDKLELTFTLGSVIINGETTVSTADLEATNGIVHVIDTVLLPSNLTDEEVDEVEQEEQTLIPDTSDTPSLGWLFVTTGLMLVLLSFVFRKKPVVKK